MEITFKSDKKYRDKYFTSAHFAHPAKMGIPLQRWIVEHYTQPGETILDPMAGSGTILIACTMGRNVICVELEEKFVKMQKDNWAKVQTIGAELGYSMGTAQILQGDARDFEGILCDSIITSLPYENAIAKGDAGPLAHASHNPNFKDKRQGYTGKIDKIVTSPPYEASVDVPESKQSERAERLRKAGYDPKNYQGGKGRNSQQDWSYHPVDSIITSPPYEAAVTGKDGIDWSKGTRGKKEGNKPRDQSKEPAFMNKAIGGAGFRYSSAKENIGNLKSDSYLSAMLQVYRQCYKVLKPEGGLLILVTKNFIREKREIRLDLDTISLCEQAGFTFVERHYRKLTTQSFWRTIYRQKYPDAPVLDKEDILIFKR